MLQGLLQPARAADLVAGLKGLAHPNRLRLVAYLLLHGEQKVGDLVRELQLPQAAASQALATLRRAGQVQVRKQGGFRYYSAVHADLQLLLTCLARCCEHRQQEPSPTPRRRRQRG
ncbi:MAG: metalloregulator ArsR/SmtB family transcription factor [Myxococcota bacterium]|nr:metalloregulator ArsR/SmtB family transcription factor [Myxococcota bacterium]